MSSCVRLGAEPESLETDLAPSCSYSQSSLRDSTCWMLSPFSAELLDEELASPKSSPSPNIVNAEMIRQSLGDFTKYIRQPALLGSR